MENIKTISSAFSDHGGYSWKTSFGSSFWEFTLTDQLINELLNNQRDTEEIRKRNLKTLIRQINLKHKMPKLMG